MKRDNSLVMVVLAVLVGAMGASLLRSSRADASVEAGPGEPHVVQISPTANTKWGGGTTRDLYRLWSDGAVDILRIFDSDENCTIGQPQVCYRVTIPEDFGSRSDLNADGVVDGGDLGILLSEWSQSGDRVR